MSAQGPFLEIHIHLMDGTVSRFVHNDATTAQRFLNSIQPHQVFSPHELIIADTYSMTVIPTASIDRIDFVMDRYPGWPFSHDIQDVIEISREEFQEREAGKPGDTPRSEHVAPGGVPVVGYAQLRLRNSEKLYIEVHLLAHHQTAIERGLSIHQWFRNAHVMVLRRRNGGAILLNPASIVQLSLFPGPSETPLNAWLAHPLTGN